MEKLAMVIMLALFAGGCDCGDCDRIEACIVHNEAEMKDFRVDGVELEWPEDCDGDIIPGTFLEFFCDHAERLEECLDEWDYCEC